MPFLPFRESARVLPLCLTILHYACSTILAPDDSNSSQAATSQSAKKLVSLQAVGLDGTALDRGADPCEDFYEFACGGWLSDTQLPPHHQRWTKSFSSIRKRNIYSLKEIAEEAVEVYRSDGYVEDPILEKIGAFYGACMDTAKISSLGAEPLRPLLALTDEVTDVTSLARVLAELHRHKIWAFFEFLPLQDFKDASRIIGVLDHGGLGLPEPIYYLSLSSRRMRRIREAYVEHMVHMMRLLGIPLAEAQMVAEDVLRIETSLARVSKSPDERRDPVGMYNRLDLDGVRRTAPKFDWKKYVDALGYPGINDINVTAPLFLVGFNKIVAQAFPRALQSYLRWHVVRKYAGALSEPFIKEQDSFRKIVGLAAPETPRWKICIQSTEQALGDLLSRVFVERRFTKNSKPRAIRYVEAIKQAFAANLDQIAWMDSETRQHAMTKLGEFSYLIGYPEKWKDYGFDVTDEYATNLLNGAAFETYNDLYRIGQPTDRSRWGQSIPSVSAYYHPLKNQVVFTAGVLQPPFYSAEANLPVNMGAMGAVVGHELTHAFDSQGARFDGRGNPQIWWSVAVREAFDERAACLERQYSAFEPIDGVNLNGRLTLRENIADLGGLKLAFVAYRALKKSVETTYLAEEFTEDQQFFIANAQLWCTIADDEEHRRRAEIDPHADARSRVNGPMANFPPFAEAFHCGKGARMRADPVCEVW